jgi:3-oxoacyl-[acyl-carrier protein] reductase
MQLGLTGKRAIVLAASRGLGYGCAEALAREGCRVAIVSRDADRIGLAADQIRRSTKAEVLPIAADVCAPDGPREAVDTCVATFGGLEIALHNAGGPPAGGLETVTIDQWYRAFDQNFLSFIRLAQAAVPHMKAAGYGRLLAITSSSIKQPIPDLILSNALRTGVWGAAKTLSRELAASNILVNVIAPGRIATERLDELDRAVAARTGSSPEAVRAASVQTIPLGRLGRPAELANLAVFLASEAASYITGTAIQVDGGMGTAL